MRAVRTALSVMGLLVAFNCSTDPPCSNHSDSHGSWSLSNGGCGYECVETCDPGWLACNGASEGCNTADTSGPPHTRLTDDGSSDFGCGGGGGIGMIGQCQINCDPGWFDCNNNTSDGCETSSSVGCGVPDASSFDAKTKDVGPPSPPPPEQLATLASESRGLTSCSGWVFYMDGAELWSIDSLHTVKQVATSPTLPAHGIACDGSYVYWATLADADASTPNGALFRIAIVKGTIETLWMGIDPQSGIDTRGDVFLMTSSGLAVWGADAGLVSWMPATTTDAYKPFALASTATWSLANASIQRRANSDPASVAIIDDAGVASALVSSGGDPIVVLHDTDASDILAQVTLDDAGSGHLGVLDASVHRVVATSGAAKIVVASDDTIYVVQPPVVTQLYTTTEHLVDVVVDASGDVFWTTRGNGTSPGAVWEGALQ